MMTDRCIVLKPGKEKAIINRHHWIFSGAIQNMPTEFIDGDVFPVYSSEKKLLGSAYFNRKSQLVGRMVAFDATPPLEAMQRNLEAAIALRNQLFRASDTNAFRLINGEGDRLPGLVVDRYGDVLVVQFSTLGMDRLRNWWMDALIKELKPSAIYEKSNLPSRKEEGLTPIQQSLFGQISDEIEVRENGLRFLVSIVEGQKTGFFLDQREMRLWVKQLAKKKRVLNCFSYTGAFSVYAAAGGASQVDSVDISETAMQMARRNMQLNGIAVDNHEFYKADVFQFLRERELNYDLIILDPPAFAKRRKDLIAACRGYKDINRIALQKMPKGSLLLTCSCSYHVDAELFQKVIFQASVEANRVVRIIGMHRVASDHPLNICHPEGDYLKSLLLYVE